MTQPQQFLDNGKARWPAGVYDSFECGYKHPRAPHVHGPNGPEIVTEGDWILNRVKVVFMTRDEYLLLIRTAQAVNLLILNHPVMLESQKQQFRDALEVVRAAHNYDDVK